VRSVIVTHAVAVGFAALYAAATAPSTAAMVAPSAFTGAMPERVMLPSGATRAVLIC